jgi:hypothetical protein
MTKPSDVQRDQATAAIEDTEPEVIQDLQLTGADAGAVGGGARVIILNDISAPTHVDHSSPM